MESLLFELPPELIAEICQHLTLPTVASCRLVSRRARHAFTPEFLLYIAEDQSFDLTLDGFWKLHIVSSSRDLRRVVRNIHLVCPYYHEMPGEQGLETTFPSNLDPVDEPFVREPRQLLPERERKWMDDRQAEQYAFAGSSMADALSWIFRRFGQLQELKLEATVILGEGKRFNPDRVQHLAWRELWSRAIQAYRVVLAALARSQVQVSNLSIFSDTKLCSIPTNEAAAVLPMLKHEGFNPIGVYIRSLSISVATTVEPWRPLHQTEVEGVDDDFYDIFDISGGRKLPIYDPAIDANADFEGFARLIACMPNLESLSLHLYRTWKEDPQWAIENIPYQALLPSLLRTASLRHLKYLSLNGIATCPEVVRDIRPHCPDLEELTLRNMFITSGLWDYALEQIVTTQPPLKRLRLSNLWRMPADESLFPACTNLESPSRRLTQQDYHDLALGRASAERQHYAMKDAMEWHTREFGAEELQGGHLDFDAGRAGGMTMANYADFTWMLTTALECGPPK